MIRRLQAIGIAIMLIVMSLTPALAVETRCPEYGEMVMMDSKFTSKITQVETTLYFCDIGDLFSYLKRNKPANFGTAVKDHPRGDWIDAKTAYYVHNEKKLKTPMGWGYAAFRDKSRAAGSGEMMDFYAAM